MSHAIYTEFAGSILIAIFAILYAPNTAAICQWANNVYKILHCSFSISLILSLSLSISLYFLWLSQDSLTISQLLSCEYNLRLTML